MLFSITQQNVCQWLKSVIWQTVTVFQHINHVRRREIFIKYYMKHLVYVYYTTSDLSLLLQADNLEKYFFF